MKLFRNQTFIYICVGTYTITMLLFVVLFLLIMTGTIRFLINDVTTNFAVQNSVAIRLTIITSLLGGVIMWIHNFIYWRNYDGYTPRGILILVFGGIYGPIYFYKYAYKMLPPRKPS